MLAGLGRTAYRRRLWIIAIWVVVAVAGAVFGGSIYDRTQSIDTLPADAPAAVAQDRLDASKRVKNARFTQVALSTIAGNPAMEQDQLFRRVRG